MSETVKERSRYTPEYDYRSTGIEGPVDRKDTESPASRSVDWSYTNSRPIAQKNTKFFLLRQSRSTGVRDRSTGKSENSAT